MKFMKYSLFVLLAALTAAPAFAQKTDSMYKKIVKAVKAASEQAYEKAKDKKNVCFYCGEEIAEPYQHCMKNPHSGMCSPTEVKYKAPENNQPPTHCPDCGKELSFDERYHDAKHTCSKKDTAGVKCVFCGEEIVEDYQHCTKNPHGGLCSPTEVKHKAPNVQQPPTHCPHCKKELSIDERYHGAEHQCQKKDTTVGKCAFCGKEILSSGQHCAAKNYVGLCTAAH